MELNKNANWALGAAFALCPILQPEDSPIVEFPNTITQKDIDVLEKVLTKYKFSGFVSITTGEKNWHFSDMPEEADK